MKFILLSTLLFVSNLIEAQSLNKEKYSQAVDFLNCKAAEFSVKGLKSEMKFKEQCPCDKNINYKTLSTFLNQEKIDATKELSLEIESLKEEFKSNWSIDEAIDFLSQAFEDNKKFKKLYSFESKKGRKESEDYKIFKTELNNGFLSILNTDHESSPSESEVNSAMQDRVSALENKIETLEQKPTQPKKSFGVVYQITFSIIVAVVLSVMFFLIYFRKTNQKTSSGNSMVDKDWVIKKINEAPFYSQNSRSESSLDIKNIRTEIQDLKTLVGQLERKIERNEPHVLTLEKPNDNVSYHETRSETIYLSTPNTDGTFNESSAHASYREGASIYKFTKISNSKAEFQIDERESSVKLALQYPDKNIDPVCEALNAFNPRARSIITIEGGVGEVELIGDKWKVNRKAKIRYDN